MVRVLLLKAKFAVLAISEGLRQENTDVRVTVISPGGRCDAHFSQH